MSNHRRIDLGGGFFAYKNLLDYNIERNLDTIEFDNTCSPEANPMPGYMKGGECYNIYGRFIMIEQDSDFHPNPLQGYITIYRSMVPFEYYFIFNGHHVYTGPVYCIYKPGTETMFFTSQCPLDSDDD